MYFHLSTEKKGEAIPGSPWVSHWNRELLVTRMRVEIDGHMGLIKKVEAKKKLKELKEKEKKEKYKKTKKKKTSSSESDPSENELDFSSESKSQEDSEEPRRKQPTTMAKK
ncbi:hypothetical protein Ahy_A03g013718 isoform B [Arachis hypogaea]|uniref:Uncharacterized protein n=1 Tax=Arachis hypogaea TaxID=3818 RepID=A0A445DW25_ARAHY|nr:hypothetical protein Ahy_A03g013718 isoform B [Arachis hypogaea]